jgi:hypothetical protein
MADPTYKFTGGKYGATGKRGAAFAPKFEHVPRIGSGGGSGRV